MFYNGNLKKLLFLNVSAKKLFNQRGKNRWFSFYPFNKEKKTYSIVFKNFAKRIFPRICTFFSQKRIENIREFVSLYLVVKREKNLNKFPENFKKKVFFTIRKTFFLKRIFDDLSPLRVKRKTNLIALRKFFLSPFFTQIDELWNDLVHFIIVFCKNFSKKNSQNKIIGFLTLLSKSLWVIDCQYEKFLKRKTHGGQIIPPPFFFMSIFARKFYRGLWEEISHLEIAFFPQKKNKILKEIELRRLSFYLRIISRKQKRLEIFKLNQLELVFSLNVLSFSFQSYAEYNRISLERIEKNHLRNFPRNVDKFSFFKTVEPSKKKSKFSEEFGSNSILFRKFNRLKDYEPFDISSYLPHDKQKRGKFLENLPFPFPIELLEFIPGSNKKKIIVCWKIPFDKNKRNLSLTNSITKKEKENFPLYYSRNMLKFQK